MDFANRNADTRDRGEHQGAQEQNRDHIRRGRPQTNTLQSAFGLYSWRQRHIGPLLDVHLEQATIKVVQIQRHGGERVQLGGFVCECSGRRRRRFSKHRRRYIRQQAKIEIGSAKRLLFGLCQGRRRKSLSRLVKMLVIGLWENYSFDFKWTEKNQLDKDLLTPLEEDEDNLRMQIFNFGLKQLQRDLNERLRQSNTLLGDSVQSKQLNSFVLIWFIDLIIVVVQANKIIKHALSTPKHSRSPHSTASQTASKKSCPPLKPMWPRSSWIWHRL